jgi:hypothetical protein
MLAIQQEQRAWLELQRFVQRIFRARVVGM